MPNYGGIKRNGEEGNQYQPEEEVVKNSLERLRAGSYENALDALVDLRVVLKLPPLSEEQLGEIQDAIRLIDPYAPLPPNVENCSSERYRQMIYDVDELLANVEAPNNGQERQHLEQILQFAADRANLTIGLITAEALPSLYVLMGLGIARIERPEVLATQRRREAQRIISPQNSWKGGTLSVTINLEALGETIRELQELEVHNVNMRNTSGESTLILQTTNKDGYLDWLKNKIRELLELVPPLARFEKFVETFKELSKTEQARLLGYEGYSYAVIGAVRECCGLPPISLPMIPPEQLSIAFKNNWLNGVLFAQTIPALESIEKPKDNLVPRIEETINGFAASVKKIADSYNQEEDSYISAMNALRNR